MSARTETRVKLLETELERIIEFAAERIILFGSMADARRRVGEWTDLDLVIVAETELPFHRRAGEILRRARPEVGVDVRIHAARVGMDEGRKSLHKRRRAWKRAGRL